MKIIEKIRIDQYSEFLLTNASDGSIVEVARRLSSILINAFECRHIIFLRKKRGVLELNYYHGIRAFNKTDFSIPYNQKLDQEFRNDYLPRSIDEIESMIPPKFKEKNKQFGMDIFFPVFWRENLYGVYFIKSNLKIQKEAFSLLIASLAQSLSAAYHIKWHESKKEAIANQAKTETRFIAKSEEGQGYVTKILRLVKFKKSDTIVLKLIETFKDVTGLKNLAYIYDSSSHSKNTSILQNGLSGRFDLPKNLSVSDIVPSISGKNIYDIDGIKTGNPLSDSWLDLLQKNGAKYIASMPLTSQRQGLLVWSDSHDLNSLSKHLDMFKRHTTDVVENAENFETIEELSYTDNLTGLANQRYFIKRLSEELNRAKRYKRKLALIIFDVDELKSVNDRYGHLAGDALLSKMGEILKTSIRSIDVVARYGGDEFCVIMPETDVETCHKFMVRLQNKIRQTNISTEHIEKPINSTISMGGAIFPDNGDDDKKLIFAADMALLKAKESGRNQFIISSKEYVK